MAEDYLDSFARESEEQITQLNNALLDFEDDPSDESAMDRIFRTAHTLKGNAGAMGFEPAEELAHAIEDLLEAIRSNRVAVSPELMDAIFEGVDELDAMIEEAVQHGEVRRDADDVIESLREHATVEGLAEPTDAEIDSLLSSLSAPSDADYSVYHARLAVTGDEAIHGRAVIDALDDAFELLGTDPEGDTVDAGEYDGVLDAAFASVVTRAAVEAALDPVDAVQQYVITDVTDHVAASATPETGDDAEEDAASESVDPADVSVDELLQDEEVDQFDDLDEMAEEVGDTSEFEDLGDAGSFADLGITEDDVDVGIEEPGEPAADEEAADAPADDDEVEDAAAEFAQLKEEVDPVGFDELQDELADLEFDEYDSDEEVGFDELLDEDELAQEGAFAVGDDAAPSAAEEAEAPSAASEADAASAGEATADADAADADAAEHDATAEDLFGGPSPDAEEAPTADATSAAADDESSADAETASPEEPAVTADEAPAASEVDAADAEVETAEADAEAADAAAETADTSADSVAAEAEGGDEAAAEAEETAAEAEPTTEAEAPPTAEVSDGDAEAADVAPDAEEEAVSDADTAVSPDAEADAAPDTEVDLAADATEASVSPDPDEPFDPDRPTTDEPAFGEGGLDLSDSGVDEPEGDEEAAVPMAEDELDLEDSFEDVEADPMAADADTAEAADGPDEEFDLGEDAIDFGEGTVPAAEESAPDDDPIASEADAPEVGDVLEDDSFGEEPADLDVEADVEESPAADVGDFGDEESVLDLDGASVAGAEESTAEAGGVESVEGSDVEADSGGLDADAGSEALGTDAADLEGPTADATTGGTAGDAVEDPGFSDSPTGGDAEADAGPEVDDERLELVRSLGVPTWSDDADGGGRSTQSIRVDVEQLDRMLNLVEGLVTSRARLRRALIEDEPREVLDDELDDLEDVTSELQDTVMDVRLVPLRSAVNKLPRIVRDVAREEEKEVDFEMIGESVELDRSILDEIGDPLVHVVRNAVDHGIEPPEVREEAGKDPAGSIELRATRERDRVTITVEDDGAGIDVEAVRDAAVEEGIHTREEVEALDDEAVQDLIFHSGFSTAAEVTDVSGRGVGLDVVADTVDRLDGSVHVESEPGEGTTISMELPVSLAIAEVLFVDVGGEEYGIPIKTVDEIGPVIGVETQDGQEVLVSDGGEDRRELIRLDEALSTPGAADPNSGMLVHLRDDVREASVHCEAVREQQEVVVKPFEGILGDVPGLSGATVLGDGDVVTILDVETL